MAQSGVTDYPALIDKLFCGLGLGDAAAFAQALPNPTRFASPFMSCAGVDTPRNRALVISFNRLFRL